MRRLAPLALLILLLAACGGESQPADVDDGTPPGNGGASGAGAGTVVLQVPVTGLPLDTDGFDLRLDGTSWRRVATTTMRFGLSEGRHTLALGGLAPGCESSAGTIEVQVVSGGVHEVELPVRCRGGVLRWRAEAMSGEDLDLDGYALEALREGTLARVAAPIARADSVGLAVLAAGSYELRLARLAWNCSGRFSGGPAATIAEGDTLDVTIQVSCQPLPADGIVFSDGSNIYLVSEAGGEPALIQQNGKAPSWSPDGRSIVFARDGLFDFSDWYGPYKVPGAVVMNSNGTGATPVGDVFSYAPRFLNDGRIWLGADGSGAEADAVLSADGTRRGRLGWTVPTGTGVLDASRDGAVIAVISWGGLFGGDLPRGVYAVRPDGTSLGRVLELSENDWATARLSPDGRRIALRAGTGLVVADIDGANARTLPSGGLPLAWSPDGALLLVAGGSGTLSRLEVISSRDASVPAVLWRGGASQLTADWR